MSQLGEHVKYKHSLHRMSLVLPMEPIFSGSDWVHVMKLGYMLNTTNFGIIMKH